MIPQSYEAEADNEYVIRGNAAIMKCEVPSFVSDFVFIEMWSDSDGGRFFPGGNEGKCFNEIYVLSYYFPSFFS